MGEGIRVQPGPEDAGRGEALRIEGTLGTDALGERLTDYYRNRGPAEALRRAKTVLRKPPEVRARGLQVR